MTQIDYEYLINVYNDIYNQNINEHQLERMLKKNKKTIYKNILNYKKKIIKEKMNDIKKYSISDYNSLLIYYKEVDTLFVFSIRSFINKIKNMDKFIKHIDNNSLKYKIDNCKKDLEYLKNIINNKKYFGIFEEETKEINELLNLLEDKNIINNFEQNEKYLTQISKKIFKNIKIKIEKYNNDTIVNKPINPNKKVIKIQEYKKKEKIDKDYKQINKIKENKNIELEKEYKDVKNTKIKPLQFFEYSKYRVLYDNNIPSEYLSEIIDYIENLKQEYIYLFKTTLNYNDNKKILEILLNADKLIENKINEYYKNQKIKKLV